jgi:low affinity Fe/Cu permease
MDENNVIPLIISGVKNVWVLALLTVTYWSMIQDKRNIKSLTSKIDELILALTRHEADHSNVCRYKSRKNA